MQSRESGVFTAGNLHKIVVLFWQQEESKMANLENERLEYKRELTGDTKLETTAVAFLNHKGGDICFGIEDDGTAVGVDNPDDLMQRITNRLTDAIKPNILGLLEVFTEEQDDKKIVIARLAAGMNAPYYIGRLGLPKGAYIRIGSSNKPMTMKMANEMLSGKHILPLSEIRSRRQDLTFNQLKLYYAAKKLSWNEKHFADNFGFLTSDGKYNYIAYLFADENQQMILVPRFAGESKTSPLVNNENYGDQCLITAMNKVLEKLDVANATQSKVGYPLRKEQRYIDPTALREAVINAFVHNDYTEENAPHCEIYEDKIIILSYGNPLDYMTEDDFFTGMSKPRNPAIMKIFQDLEYVEHSGRGLPMIVEKYGRGIFQFTRDAMRVFFKFDKSMEESQAKTTLETTPETTKEKYQKNTRKIPEKYQKILDVLTNNNALGRKELAEKLGEKEPTIQSRLNKLVADGYLKHVGPAKGGHWEVLGNN